MGLTARTVRKWRDRFAAEGEAGLRDLAHQPGGKMRAGHGTGIGQDIGHDEHALFSQHGVPGRSVPGLSP